MERHRLPHLAAVASLAIFTSFHFTVVLPGAEPLLEKINVFEAGADGYALYRIPAITVTAKGWCLPLRRRRRARATGTPSTSSFAVPLMAARLLARKTLRM